MSSGSLADSSRIDLHAGGGGAAKKIGVGHRARLDQVDRPAEQRFQAKLQAHVPLERSGGGRLGELDEEVVVAPARVEVPGRGRPEQLEPPYAVRLAELPKLI